MAVDPTFGVDNFNRPKVLSETETYVNNIMMLLLGRKGFYPSIPSIGMNIKDTLYEFFNDINTEEIKNELVRQCSDFLPEVNSGDFDVRKTMYKGKPLLVFSLPVIDDTNRNSVSLGITTNKYGELVYDFVEGKEQSM